MKSLGKYALVITAGLVAGATVFVLSFVGLDFVWTHVVVTDPEKIGLGDGVIVIGGGFLIGSALGVLALIFVWYRFWPARARKELPSAVREKLEAKS